MENKYMTPNLYMTCDESLIIDLLVDHHEMPKNFDVSHVLSFYRDRDFHLVLYFPNDGDKGFQMYVVKDFSLHVNELIILREIFARLMKEGYDIHLLGKAHGQMDNLVHMSKTFRAMLNPGETGLSNDD